MKTNAGSRRAPVRRRARLTDLARMILPSKREEPPAAVVPPSFPVEVPAGSVLRAEDTKPVAEKAPEPVAATTSAASSETMHTEIPAPVPTESATIPTAPPEKIPAFDPLPPPVAPPPAEPAPASIPAASVPPAEPKAEPGPKMLSTAPAPGEKKEFMLTNGERILGRVISESPDSVYLEHATLGVLTLPRTQIAKRLVEVILINGDRIVGDVVAETPECLFVRHASLGVLTVPQTQRSTRVVEAILKDGDRIIGEVLAETETYTVIRSSTLGTVTVQHRQLAMLNRKLEQVALKALPPTAPALGDKPAA